MQRNELAVDNMIITFPWFSSYTKKQAANYNLVSLTKRIKYIKGSYTGTVSLYIEVVYYTKFLWFKPSYRKCWYPVDSLKYSDNPELTQRIVVYCGSKKTLDK